MKKLILMLLLGLSLSTQAAINVYDFSTPEDEARFKHLSEELRCLVCQNQNLADSNAELAQDLRNKVYNMLQKGQSDKQIVDYMVQRYGDFVLYNPPVKASTYALWFGPLALVILALFVLLRFIRGRARTAETVLSTDEQAQLADILKPSATHPSKDDTPS